MGLGKIMLYENTDLNSRGMEVYNTFPPSVRVGQEMFRELPRKELKFMVAHRLAYLHPWLFFARVFSMKELNRLLCAICRIYEPQFQSQIRDEFIEVTKARIQKGMKKEHIDFLRPMIKKYIDQREGFSLRRYLEAVDHTAIRAGFILTNDLEKTFEILQQDLPLISGIPFRSRMRELILYSVSKQYLHLRRELGLSID
jgi:hypothetical protein